MKKQNILEKIKHTWKDKKKRRHMYIVIGGVLVLAALLTVAKADKTTVNDIEIQHTSLIVEEYGTEGDLEEETTAPGEGEQPVPDSEETPAPEETSEQIFFLEETTAPEAAQ